VTKSARRTSAIGGDMVQTAPRAAATSVRRSPASRPAAGELDRGDDRRRGGAGGAGGADRAELEIRRGRHQRAAVEPRAWVVRPISRAVELTATIAERELKEARSVAIGSPW